MPKILIVASDRALQNFLRLTLRSSGYSITTARNGTYARFHLWLNSPDLALISLPSSITGSVDTIRTIRNRSNIPILAILGAADRTWVEKALENGADDYLLAPFSPSELRERIGALARQSREWKEALAGRNSPLVLSSISLESSTLRLILGHNSLRLATPDFILLSYFVANRGNVGSRTEVIHQVWGKDGAGGELLLDSTLARLQEQIGFDRGQPQYASGRDSFPVKLPAQLEMKSSD